IFSLQEFNENFDIDKVSLGGPVFDLVKLGWVNNQHMRMKDLKELTELSIPFFRNAGLIGEELTEKEFENISKVVDILREGAQTIKEIVTQSEVYFKDEYTLPVVTEETDKKEVKGIERLYTVIQDEIGKKSINLFEEKIFACDEEISVDKAKEILKETLDTIGEGPGKVYMPLRAVLTGLPKGADLYNLVSIIGKARTLARIERMKKLYNI
ncbi:MAG: glutamate--tRNA ligase, partial [Fusobacteriaceae bacterium]